MPLARNLPFILSSAAIAILSVILLSTPWNASDGFDDLVVWNGTIFTADSDVPVSDSMAVRDGRIVRVGNYSSVRDLVGRKTRDLNLKGKIVVPGFIDSHVHFISGGLQMARVALRDVKTKAEFTKRIEEAANGKLKGDWILGGGWNNDFWGGDLPAASWLDRITPENPVWLSRMDGHMGLANTVALKMAGITTKTPDPIGGSILRDTREEPTGLLVDDAMKLVMSMIPEISVHDRRDALVRASKHALSRGVTTVIDFGRFFPGAAVEDVWQDFSDVYQWADSTGKMLIRVCLFFPMQTSSRLIELYKTKGKSLSEKIYLGGLKAFSDGSLGSNSALFYEPYIGEPDNYGLQLADLDWLLNETFSLEKYQLQVAIHAIGDKANDLILDLYKSLVSLHGPRDRRHRIEHAQHLAPGAPERFGQQDLIASVQPQHLLDDAESAERKIGANRAHTGSYLFQSLLYNKARLIFGSDWPVADINPLEAIRTAVLRIPPGWVAAWNPSECLSLNDAIAASTISAAYGSFLDNDLGSLSAGKLADFVILSASSLDSLCIEPYPTILATYTSGLQVYP